MSAQAARPGGNLSIALPAEVDTDLRHAHGGDFRSMTYEQLVERYNRFRRNEGRLASPAGSRQGFKALIALQSRILEAEPGRWPGFTGPNVKYFDVQNSAGLRQRAIDHKEDPPLRRLRVHDTTKDQNEVFAVLGRGD